MLVKVYSIYDSKAQAYLQPFFAATHALAFRNCERACRNPESPFVQFPVDFTLFCLGAFDDEIGVLAPHPNQENLGNFIQFLPAAADTAA